MLDFRGRGLHLTRLGLIHPPLWAPLGGLEGAARAGRPWGPPPCPPGESLLFAHAGAQEGHSEQGDPLGGLPRLHLRDPAAAVSPGGL